MFRLVVAYKSQSAWFGKSEKLLPSFKCSFLSIWRKRYLLETLSQLFLIKMKLAVLTVALLLCAVLATTVTAAPSDERGKNFSCFYMLLYPCSFYLSWHHVRIVTEQLDWNIPDTAQCYCNSLGCVCLPFIGCIACEQVQTQREPGTLFYCYFTHAHSI